MSVNTRDDTSGDAQSGPASLMKTPAQSHSKLLEFLRQFRLQSAASIWRLCTGGRWNAKTECRKVAIHQNRTVAATHILLHVAPLAGAITLLVFQWTNYWVSDKGDYSSTLQFAAKVHELVMQPSIVEVLLSHVRTGLIDGLLPLGTLSAAIQPTQLSYLWSLNFLSIFRTHTIQKWQRVGFIIAVPVLFALTALVGPSSAVLTIPRASSPRILSDEMKYAAESVEATYPPRNFSAARFEMCVLY